jgi:hypothetical protein
VTVNFHGFFFSFGSQSERFPRSAILVVCASDLDSLSSGNLERFVQSLTFSPEFEICEIRSHLFGQFVPLQSISVPDSVELIQTNAFVDREENDTFCSVETLSLKVDRMRLRSSQ